MATTYSKEIHVKHLEEKRTAVKEIYKDQEDLIKKALSFQKYCDKNPPKRMSTAFKRALKMTAMAMGLRMMEAQKQMVISQPIPRYPSGASFPATDQKTPEKNQ